MMPIWVAIAFIVAFVLTTAVTVVFKRKLCTLAPSERHAISEQESEVQLARPHVVFSIITMAIAIALIALPGDDVRSNIAAVAVLYALSVTIFARVAWVWLTWTQTDDPLIVWVKDLPTGGIRPGHRSLVDHSREQEVEGPTR